VVVRLLAARQHGNPPAVAEEARRLRALAETLDATQPGLGEELRSLALVSLGITEFWAARFEDAERHLDEGVTLARRIGRPFLEFSGLVYQAGIELFRSFTRAAERSGQAIELAERQGWTDEPVACYAYSILADVPAWRPCSGPARTVRAPLSWLRNPPDRGRRLHPAAYETRCMPSTTTAPADEELGA
jgi:LuxR family maltose regulon positive regulatory protein